MERICKISIWLLLIILIGIPGIGQDNPMESGNFRKGEKSFLGISNEDGLSCAECHYFEEPDSINWNPSAMELAARSGIYQSEGLDAYFNSPKGELMKQVHKGINLSDSEEGEIISYLDHLQKSPFIASAPVRWKLILFLGMLGMLILLWIEKIRIKKIPRIVRRVLVPAAWLVMLAIFVQDALGFNLSKNYAPVQPIKFSHAIHSTDNQIECNYCHPGVLKGKNAGVPPVSLCMNCHKHVKEGTRSGAFEINKVLQAAEDSIPIRWIRIHNLPDFTYFNHMQHVSIGGVDCIECHGDVENMHIAKQVEDLSMGWCIKCHDETRVDFSNEYYKTYYPVLNDSLLTGKMDSIMVSDINGRECSVCHY